MVHEPGGIDPAAAEETADQFLHAHGISTDSQSLRGTLGRTARAYARTVQPVPVSA
ncbi:hypothetical protein AB0K74_48410 [Streptomyces sp. NPDC056159]